MTAIAIKPSRVATPSGNGAAAPQPAAATLPAGVLPLDEALATLHAQKDAWVATGIDQRIALLAEIRQRMAAIGERWVGAILEAKGTAGDAFGVGEEWANYALALHWMRLLHRSLLDVQRYGRPRLPAAPKTRPNGRVTVRVFPQTLFDRMLFMGVTGEVWMQPGVTAVDVTARQAAIYQDQSHPGQVALVLGAGNAAPMLPDDILHQMFIAGRVVLFKLNPVNAYLGPLLDEALQPLVRRGFLRIVAGGADEGAYLCAHPAVDAVHLTGCDKTFEAIIFGPGEEGQRRKAERRPLLDMPVTAELGNVTPIIVVPGPWSRRNLAEHALHLATWLVLNAGCNCISERVIVQQRDWPLREPLLAAMGEVLSRTPTHRAYYPGAAERYAAFLDAHPNARRFGAPQLGHLPWTLLPDVDPANHDDICLTREAFCSLVAETGLPASDPADFLDRAVAFTNDTLWGTLGATIFVHPASLADRRTAAAFERAIAALRYGTITVNFWAGYGYYLGLSPWGAYPGSDLYDVQSGIGMANNALMLDGAEKTIYRAPFHKLVDPYTLQSKRVAEFGRKLAAYDGATSLASFVSLLWTALRCWPAQAR
jgi:acyl-CoA reductase-like NAD-dependent aldehyde dehydrogenase